MTGEEERNRNEFLPEWVFTFDDQCATQKESWPPRNPAANFDWDQPSHEVYYDPSNDLEFHTSDFKEARQKLDYSYHRNPVQPRQELQDVILSRVIQAAKEKVDNDAAGESKQETEITPNCRRPWMVFSAGTMAVGKGYVMSTLNDRGLFPLNDMVHIDPDMIKTELPEMTGYLDKDEESAATKVHRESTQMADILLEYALTCRYPTVVDGSLKDVEYYKSLMARIREEFPEYQLAILHVTASPDIIRARAKSRAEKTGRAIPTDLLEENIQQVPKSVAALAPYVDVTFTIANEDDQPIQLIRKRCQKDDIQRGHGNDDQLGWKEFRETWSCNMDQCAEEREKMIQQQLSAWCESQCPGICQFSTCWKDSKCLESSKNAFTRAYPSACPRCTIGADLQCGICIHDKHRCYCTECRPANNKNSPTCQA